MTPCSRCKRHVRSETCPFCGDRVVQAPPAAALASGLSRSAILAAVLTAGACAENAAYAPAALYGAPAPPDARGSFDGGAPIDPVGVAIPPPAALYGAAPAPGSLSDAGGGADAGRTDAGKADPGKAKDGGVAKRPVPPPAPMYGMAPEYGAPMAPMYGMAPPD